MMSTTVDATQSHSRPHLASYSTTDPTGPTGSTESTESIRTIFLAIRTEKSIHEAPLELKATAKVYVGADQSLYYTNTSCLFVKSGIATNEQLAESMNIALAETSKLLGRKITCNFKPNLIVGRNMVYYGIGYLWVSNPEVYHMLLGRNPDGSERVEYVVDHNWSPPTEDMNKLLDALPKKESWVEMCQQEDEITSRYEPVMIKKVLPPLMKLPGYTYGKIQLRLYCIDEDSSEDSDGKESTESDMKLPELGTFQVSPAFVKDPDPKYCANILCTRNVPEWITEAILKHEFTPYASNSKNKIIRKVKGVRIEDTYPFVTINSKRVAFVTFDPNTKDAAFALLMTRRLQLKNGNKECMLMFNYSYRSS